MKLLDEVKWGIIGCGKVTEVKSGPAFRKIADSELVAVMRRNSELAEDYARRHGVSKWYDKAEDLIHDPEVNAVYIATPPAFHKEYAIKAAKAGKAVYVEKPMAINPEECREMIEACQENDVPLYVAYYRRRLERFLKVKEMLDKQVIGDVRFVSTVYHRPATEEEKDQNNPPWRVQQHLAGGGLFFDLASHTLDLLDFLIGPINRVHGIASNQAGFYEVEDIVTGTYRFTNGALGSGAWCFTSGTNEDKNEIIGSRGKISFATFGEGPIELSTEEGTEEWNFENPEHIQQPLIQSIVSELTGKTEIPAPSTGVTGARTSWVMEQMVNKDTFHTLPYRQSL